MFEINELKTELGSIEDIMQLCERCLLHIRIYNTSNKWVVKAGEHLLLDTDNYDNVTALIYGIGFALNTLSDEDINKLRQRIGAL